MSQIKIKFPLFVLAIFLFIMANAQTYEQDFQSRANFLIDCIESSGGATPLGYKDCGTFGDYGKYLNAKITAVFTKGQTSPYYVDAEKWVTSHEKCGQFHFNLFGLPRVLMGFPKEPSVQKSLKNYMENVFMRTDGYNAFTGEGTENHILMCRPPAYLFCELALEKFPEESERWQTNEKLKLTRDWIMYWSKRIYETGTGEFASTIYYIFDISPWLNLYDFAKDSEVKSAAKAVLDYYASEVALLYMQGNIGGTDLRGGNNSEKSLISSIGYLAWLWYGDTPTANFEQIKKTYLTGKFRNHLNAIYGCVSTYRPPMLAVKLANNQFPLPAMYYNSKPAYLLDNPSYVKSTFYRDRDFTLGAGYIPYGGWSAGCYSTVSWKLLARGDIHSTQSYQYISGQGMMLKTDGQWRSPFDQLVHHKNVLIQMTKVPVNFLEIKQHAYKTIDEWSEAWKRDFALRFPNDNKYTPVGKFNVYDEKNYTYIYIKNNGGKQTMKTQKNILFVELDTIYVAMRSLQMLSPTVSDGTIMDGTSEYGKLAGIVLEVGNKIDFKSFEDFRKKYILSSSLNLKFLNKDSLEYTSMNGDKICVKYNESGIYTEPIFDWGFGLKQQSSIFQAPPFEQPSTSNSHQLPAWNTGIGSGRLSTWTVNNSKVDLTQPWAVYEGPGFYVKNGVLLLENKGEEYKVDFTGKTPKFYDKKNETYSSKIKP